MPATYGRQVVVALSRSPKHASYGAGTYESTGAYRKQQMPTKSSNNQKTTLTISDLNGGVSQDYRGSLDRGQQIYRLNQGSSSNM